MLIPDVSCAAGAARSRTGPGPRRCLESAHQPLLLRCHTSCLNKEGKAFFILKKCSSSNANLLIQTKNRPAHGQWVLVHPAGCGQPDREVMSYLLRSPCIQTFLPSPKQPSTCFCCLWICLFWRFIRMESHRVWPFTSGFFHSA